jgi:hypothetical protein
MPYTQLLWNPRQFCGQPTIFNLNLFDNSLKPDFLIYILYSNSLPFLQLSPISFNWLQMQPLCAVLETGLNQSCFILFHHTTCNGALASDLQYLIFLKVGNRRPYFIDLITQVYIEWCRVGQLFEMIIESWSLLFVSSTAPTLLYSN